MDSHRTFRLTLLAVLLTIHTAITLRAMADVGFIGIFEAGLATWGARQVFSDLCVSLLLVSLWLVPDARRRGLPAWPFLLAMLPLGSFSPLAYAFIRELRAPVTPPAAAPARA